MFKCPSCSTLLKTANPPPAGAALKCPRCGTTFRVPAAPRPASVRPQPAPPPEPEGAIDLAGFEERPVRRTPGPKKKRGACLWVFLAAAAVLTLGCGGTIAGLVALVYLAPAPASTGRVALSSAPVENSRIVTPEGLATAPAKPPAKPTAAEKPREETGKARPPEPAPAQETGEPVSNDLKKVRDQAVAWIKDNNRFGPTHKIVADVGDEIDKRIGMRAGFIYTLGDGLVKSGKPTVLAGWSGQFFVLELTPEQGMAANIQKNGAVIKATKAQDDLRRPAARARLAEPRIDNAGKLDGGARITGTVPCEVLDKGTAGHALRLTCVLNNGTYSDQQQVAGEALAGTKPLSFSFAPISSTGSTFTGPVVAFLELCVPASPGKPAVLVSNTVATVFNAVPATAGKPDDVVAMIKRLDGEYQVDDNAPGKPIVSVSLSGEKVTDADLALLRGLKRLESLYLGDAENVTDAGLAHVEGLTSLTHLDLSGTAITDAGLAHLTPLTNLVDLDLSGTKLKGDAFGQLAGLTKLESLMLPSENYTANQLKPLTALQNLQQIGLNWTEDTDAKLGVLAELHKLKSLDLENTKITTQGMAYVGVLTDLESLVIVDNSPGGGGGTNAGMVHLKRLKNLRSLTLSLPHATDLGLESIAGLTGLRTLDLTGFPVTDKGMPHLANLTGLDTLRLPQAKITDAGLASLKGLTSLHNLDLEGTGVTDAGLAHLGAMQRLEWLNLNKTKVDGTGLAQLKDLSSLSQVQLNDTQFSEAGAAAAGELKHLVTLEAGNTPLTNAGLEHLKGLTKLSFLGLNGTKITDAGLVHVKELPELGMLRLDGNPNITDAGLVHLKGLAKLGELNVTKTKVTPKGIEMLKAALPKLDVTTDSN